MIIAAFGDVQPAHGDSPGASNGYARSTIPWQRGVLVPQPEPRAERSCGRVGATQTVMLGGDNEKVQVPKSHGPVSARFTMRLERLHQARAEAEILPTGCLLSRAMLSCWPLSRGPSSQGVEFLH